MRRHVSARERESLHPVLVELMNARRLSPIRRMSYEFRLTKCSSVAKQIANVRNIRATHDLVGHFPKAGSPPCPAPRPLPPPPLSFHFVKPVKREKREVPFKFQMMNACGKQHLLPSAFFVRTHTYILYRIIWT